MRKIPTLDVRNPPDTFQDRSLVRFRAMIQDTSTSTEMYLSKSRSGECGGWGIEFAAAEENAHVDFADLRECSVLWAVSVPSQTAWSAKELDGPIERTQIYTFTFTFHYIYMLLHRSGACSSFGFAHTLPTTAFSQIPTLFRHTSGSTSEGTNSPLRCMPFRLIDHS